MSRATDRLRWVYRRATSPWRSLPDFFIAGAQKAGTTSLYAWLCEHPSVRRAWVKEVHFFDRQPQRGLGWYRAHFPLRRQLERRDGRRILTGEASPVSLFYPCVPEAAARALPHAKVLVLLRDPVARACSSSSPRTSPLIPRASTLGCSTS